MSRRGARGATIGRVQEMTGEIDTVLCDLDGVVWLAHQPIPGSVEAIAELRAHGVRVLFVTNNSAATLGQHERALAGVGIPAHGDVVSSATAAAHLVQAGERVLVAAGPGVVEALEQRGAEAVLNTGAVVSGAFDAVVVGMHREFDYERLAVAATTVRRGARLIGTNADSTYPTPGGLLPGGGSILAAVASASGRAPVIAGKPHPPMVDAVTSLVAVGGSSFHPERVIMIGDRPETDGLFAERLGCRFALVRTGVSAPDETIATRVDIDAADLASVAHLVVSGTQ